MVFLPVLVGVWELIDYACSSLTHPIFRFVRPHYLLCIILYIIFAGSCLLSKDLKCVILE